MNVIKMICYRAESAVAQWMAPCLAKADNEKRMVIKKVIQSSADLTHDYENKTLSINLHSLQASRLNIATNELALLLNQTETIFPGTDLKMIFKITANLNCQRSGVLRIKAFGYASIQYKDRITYSLFPVTVHHMHSPYLST